MQGLQKKRVNSIPDADIEVLTRATPAAGLTAFVLLVTLAGQLPHFLLHHQLHQH
jgi:hypothetical protein